MGARLWWRWLQGGADLWKIIWERKYEMPNTTTGKLKVNTTPKGCNVWNLANMNRDLTREHNFWEIRGGNTTLFWEDSSQQQ